MMSAARSLGRFELRREIGRGALSTIWEGMDSLTKALVAVKVFHFPPAMEDCERARLLQRCQREVTAASRINHPNVVKVFGAGEAENGFYIVMEFVRGVSVRERLRMEGKFDAGSTARIAIQLCDALWAAHRLRIVHCDLKPENILLQVVGRLQERVKLVDFGVAQVSRAPGEVMGAWGGSPAYMSPEQVTGGALDGRSDIFSLGAVLFEMLTGQPAFEGDSMMAVVHKVVNEPLEVGQIPPPFRGIVAKATEKRASLRFKSVVEMREALEAGLGKP